MLLNWIRNRWRGITARIGSATSAARSTYNGIRTAVQLGTTAVRVLRTIGAKTEIARKKGMIIQINSTNIRNTEELVRGSFKAIEGSFAVFADGKVTFSDAGILFNIAQPIQAAIEEVAEVKNELATASNDEFDRAFSAGAAGFSIPEKPELTADISGLVKGIFHATRMFVRSAAQKEEAPLPE